MRLIVERFDSCITPLYLCVSVANGLKLFSFGAGVFSQAAGAVVVAAVDAADHGDSAGADQLDDAERAHQVDEGFDLLFLAGDFDHHLVGGDVDDAAAEDVGQLANFGALARLHA